MKKLLGIVVLGLLLSGNAYAQKLVYDCSYDSSYSGSADISQMYYTVDVQNKYFEINYNHKGKNYIISNTNGRLQYFEMDKSNITYEIEGLNQRFTFNFGNDNFKDQPIKVSQRNKSTVIYCAKNTMLSGKPIEQNSSNNTNDKIAQSKQICKDLGFKVNSEKFADCALKMMSIQFEATNKVASGSGTKQEIIVKHKQDYDIWDAMLDMSNALSGSSSNNNSSSSGSSGTRCVIQKTHAWGHTVMNCN